MDSSVHFLDSLSDRKSIFHTTIEFVYLFVFVFVSEKCDERSCTCKIVLVFFCICLCTWIQFNLHANSRILHGAFEKETRKQNVLCSMCFRFFYQRIVNTNTMNKELVDPNFKYKPKCTQQSRNKNNPHKLWQRSCYIPLAMSSIENGNAIGLCDELHAYK